MQKLIHRYLVANGLIFFFELIICLVLFFVVDGNYIETFQTELIFAFTAIIILVNLMIALISFTKLSNAKNKSDISTLKVLGNDIQAAYDFGKIGLIITDDNDNVIWVNNLFRDVEKSLVDSEIYSYFNGLARFKDSNTDETSIEFNGCYYLVRYLKEANLYIFKDVTELRNVYDETFKHRPSVGIITIDNYQDMANMLDDLSINDNLAVIQKVIVDYAKKHHMLLKKYKNDSYIFLCNREDYDEILKDRFSLLDDLKEEKEDNDFTLSIGIASGIDNYNRLFEMASKALDVALSRGGDQAVASTYEDNLQFFGGQTETKEKKNSVQSRVMSNSLKALVEEAKNVYIMGHNIADLDAIGSALGLYCFVKGVAKNTPVKIIYDEFKLENKTKKAFKATFTKEQINEMCIAPSEALDKIEPKDLLIVTDFHSLETAMYPNLIKKAEHIAIIDHHRRSMTSIDNPEFSYIEPSASSASELVVEMIRYASCQIDVPEDIATFMLAGIILDTNYYRNHIGARTYDASYILKTFGADNNLADSFLKVELEEYALKNSIMSRATYPCAGVLLTYASNDEIVEQAMLARVATEALQISGINASFVIGRISDRIIGLSSRSDGSISCQLICETFEGGGSYTAAAAKFKDSTNVDIVRKRVEEVIKQYVNGLRQKKIIGGD